jgi:hypothetical protein
MIFRDSVRQRRAGGSGGVVVTEEAVGDRGDRTLPADRLVNACGQNNVRRKLRVGESD